MLLLIINMLYKTLYLSICTYISENICDIKLICISYLHWQKYELCFGNINGQLIVTVSELITSLEKYDPPSILQINEYYCYAAYS